MIVKHCVAVTLSKLYLSHGRDVTVTTYVALWCGTRSIGRVAMTFRPRHAIDAGLLRVHILSSGVDRKDLAGTMPIKTAMAQLGNNI